MSDHRSANEFADRLAATYGEGLVAVVLYGSAARGDYRPGVSDLNLLVVLRHADAVTLHRASALAREWAEAGNPPPLIMSESEWASSADVFPIEYSDMKAHHVVLRGLDPFGEVDIRWSDLRLQCEHELKSKKIRLREHYLLVADDPAQLGDLLKQSLPTFMTLFRTTLRLAGRSVPGDGVEVIQETASLAGFDGGPVQAVYRARAEASDGFAPGAEDVVVVGYLDAVQRTGELLDRLTTPPAGAAN
jgi:predicted nucleotidyltransferase